MHVGWGRKGKRRRCAEVCEPGEHPVCVGVCAGRCGLGEGGFTEVCDGADLGVCVFGVWLGWLGVLCGERGTRGGVRRRGSRRLCVLALVCSVRGLVGWVYCGGMRGRECEGGCVPGYRRAHATGRQAYGLRTQPYPGGAPPPHTHTHTRARARKMTTLPHWYPSYQRATSNQPITVHTWTP